MTDLENTYLLIPKLDQWPFGQTCHCRLGRCTIQHNIFQQSTCRWKTRQSNRPGFARRRDIKELAAYKIPHASTWSARSHKCASAPQRGGNQSSSISIRTCLLVSSWAFPRLIHPRFAQNRKPEQKNTIIKSCLPRKLTLLHRSSWEDSSSGSCSLLTCLGVGMWTSMADFVSLAQRVFHANSQARLQGISIAKKNPSWHIMVSPKRACSKVKLMKFPLLQTFVFCFHRVRLKSCSEFQLQNRKFGTASSFAASKITLLVLLLELGSLIRTGVSNCTLGSLIDCWN